MPVDQTERPNAATAAITAATRAIATAQSAVASANAQVAALERATNKRRDLAASAATAAPTAIAAATTETERALTRRLFAAIPNVLALSQAHSEADANDEPTEREKHEAWNTARAEVEALATEIVKLPPETAADALRRVKLFRQSLAFTEGADLDGEIDEMFSEDFAVMGSAAIAALTAFAEREPDRTAWDDAVKALRDAEWRLTCANREEDDLRQAAEVEPGVMEALDARIRQGYADRDAARTKLLALDPPDVGGLLVKMEIVFDHAAVGDVASYASRARLRGEVPITAEYLWDAEDETLRPAFAMLAIDAAKLQDRSLPADWQEFIAGAGHTRPNFRDAAQRAIEAGMSPRDLISVRLDGREPEDNLPVLTFGGGAPAFATPKGCWVWKSVERLAAEPVQ